MINWFDVPSESPNKDLTLKNLQVTENGTYGENGVAYSSVEVNVSGGGGSSDFSTAEVKFISSTAPTKIYYAKYITTNEELGFEQREEMGTSEEFATNATIALYNGFCVLPWNYFTGVPEEDIPVVTGDIELDLEVGFIVRGNGTITCVGTETPA